MKGVLYTWYIRWCLLFIILGNGQNILYTNKVFIELALDTDIDEVKVGLLQYDIIFVEKIISSLYLFQHKGGGDSDFDDGVLQHVKKSLNGKIINIQIVPIHRYKIGKKPSTESGPLFLGFSYVPKARTSFTQKTCYGMGVQKAWDVGYSGKGVVIAVLDVGVDRDIPDLKPAIEMELSKNFVHETAHDVTPDRLMSYPESWPIIDHGNRCSGLIAASQIHGNCCTGIAFGAKIAVLKVFDVEEYRWMSLSDVHVTKGLSHFNDAIHIYSNSWAQDQPFQSLQFYSNMTLRHGIHTGRAGKGNIYVFPVGGIAEGYTNSLYTVTINSFGFQGSITVFTGQSCACTLTSTFGQGDSHNTSFMETTSFFENNCTRDFKGTSASTAMISAMIALALEANCHLTWRDIQHLLVESSDSRYLDESRKFNLNGAGKRYHYLFGFGSLDVSRLVNLAKSWKNVPKQLSLSKSTNTFHQQIQGSVYIYYAYIDMYWDTYLSSCINRIEHVVTTISYITKNEAATEIAIKSPSGTLSILMNMEASPFLHKAIRENVEFLSVHFWGEKLNGTWAIIFKTYVSESLTSSEKFGITSCSLSISGDEIPNANYIRHTAAVPSAKEDNIIKQKETKKHQNQVAILKPSFNVILVSIIFCLLFSFSY